MEAKWEEGEQRREVKEQGQEEYKEKHIKVAEEEEEEVEGDGER